MPVFFRRAKWLGGLVLLVIGLAGLPDDIESWQKGLSALYGMGWFTESFLRWLLFSAGACLLIWVNYPAIKSRFPGKAINSSPLKIIFLGEVGQSEFIAEPAQVGPAKVSRRIFWANIYNDSGKDIKNVRGEMSSIKVLSPDGTEEDYPLFAGKTHPLIFHGGNQVLDFSPHMNVRLPLLSHATHLLPSFIRIEGHEKPFMHESKVWKVKVKVTADGCLPVERVFTASVAGLLDVKAVD